METKGCDSICGPGGPGNRECDDVATALMDRDLFERVLAPGERSEIFASQSPIVREYGPHEVRFCYVNVDGEIARLEMPEWVAQDDEAVGLLHALTLDQCRKGGGYPVALREAHEAAVVTGSDRRLFWGLVESSLAGQGLTPRLSEKARSKQVRAL
ncbi:MAG: DNA double-strand break repair nuclease NurA [Chloroflexi bacterium]|nr:DNA double-strand break repair nuclease NurA [Chloroflexota bacterium]